MARRKGQEKTIKDCLPPLTLTNHITLLLQLLEKQEKLKVERKELSAEEEKLLRNLRAQRTKIMDNVLFPAMAALLYFFKQVELHPPLDSEFDGEIRDLLGIRTSEKSEEYSRYGIDRKPMVFELLLEAILCVRWTADDFRMILADRAQMLIAYKLKHAKVKSLDAELAAMMFTQLSQAQVWTRLRAAPFKDELENAADRVIIAPKE